MENREMLRDESSSSGGWRKRWRGLRNETVASLTVCLAILSAAMSISYPSLALVGLQAEQRITTDLASWFASVFSLGAAVGSPLGGLCIEKLGRKTTVIASAVPMVVGWLFILIDEHVAMLLIGRILNGIGMGLVSVAVPVYIGEVASADMRGLLGSCFQLLFVIGSLLEFVLGIPLSWQWLAIANGCVATISAIAALLVPESPHWLLKQGQPTEAMACFTWLRGGDTSVALTDYLAAETYLLQSSTTIRVPVKELLTKKKYVEPFLVSLALMFFQQFSGINAIMNFLVQIFAAAGFDNAKVASIITTSVPLVTTTIACLLIDRVGRRVLLIVSGIIITVAQFLLALSFYLSTVKDVTNLGWLSLLALLLFNGSFNLGWGPVPWAVLGELFSPPAKGLSSGISTAACWFLSFVVVLVFLPMQDTFQPYGTFWFFSAICFVSIVFVVFLMPETKGKTLEEIELLFA